MLPDGALTKFFTRPISLVLWVTIVITVLLSFHRVRAALARLVPGGAATEETGP